MSFKITYKGSTTTLPSPDWGDEQTIDDGIIVRRSRGGTLIVFQPSTAQSKDTRLYTFTMLKDSEVSGLKSLLRSSAGQQLDFMDHNGNFFHGFIMDSEVEFIHDSHENSTSVSLQVLVVS